MVTKKEGDGEHPSSHYLVVEDAEHPSTWHLRVRDASGKPDHRMMGAAWAALHGGYRGNKYEGPDKAGAIAKLKALYKSEGMDLPSAMSDREIGRSGEWRKLVIRSPDHPITRSICPCAALCDDACGAARDRPDSYPHRGNR